MEKRSLIVSTVTIYSGMFCLQDVAAGVKFALFMLIVLISIYFLVYWAVEFTKSKVEALLQVKFLEKHCGKFLRKIAKFDWNFRKKKPASPLVVQGPLEEKAQLLEQASQREVKVILREKRFPSK